MSKLAIMDCEGICTDTPVDLADLSEIEEIWIKVISGDETCVVFYASGCKGVFDAPNARLVSFYDGAYILYSHEKGINRIKEFERRKDTYEMLSRYLWGKT